MGWGKGLWSRNSRHILSKGGENTSSLAADALEGILPLPRHNRGLVLTRVIIKISVKIDCVSPPSHTHVCHRWVYTLQKASLQAAAQQTQRFPDSLVCHFFSSKHKTKARLCRRKMTKCWELHCDPMPRRLWSVFEF